MALEAPLRSSTGSHLSAFSYNHDMSSVDSPDSGPLRSPFISMLVASAFFPLDLLTAA